MLPTASIWPMAQPALEAGVPPWKAEPSKKQLPRKTQSKGLLCQSTSAFAKDRGGGSSTDGSGSVPRQKALQCAVALRVHSCSRSLEVGAGIFSLMMFSAEHW